MKNLLIGGHDYKEFIEKDYYYVDKTLLIKELFDVNGKVTLLPRPRRFGKTLNLSMLKYFFEKTPQSTSHLFTNTAIWQEEKYRKEQGQYPVIFITFKDVKENTWEKTYEKLTIIIADEFKRHNYLLDVLAGQTAKDYTAIMERTASSVLFESALLLLTKLLHNHYQQKVIVLIDEYDAPITIAVHKKYYEDIISFMRGLLGGVLKDNNFLERGVVTGILRVAKESVFSGLNNLIVSSVTDNFFQDKFGFTQSEIDKLLAYYNFSDKAHDIKSWYNGYTFGTTTIYNPWSILNCIQNSGQLEPYWVNTSDNELIKTLIARANPSLKKELEKLLNNQATSQEIDEGLVFPGIERNDRALWSLLLYTGYLTYNKKERVGKKNIYDLVIPNEEIESLYAKLIQGIWEALLTTDKIQTLLEALVDGDSYTFAESLQEFIAHSISYHDFAPQDPERSYHLFVLGLLVNLSNTHEIKSNREAGKGRSDILLIPRDTNQLGIVLEFKKVSVAQGQTLESAAQTALDQIKEKQYYQELANRGIHNIQLIGISFLAKDIFVKFENINLK